MRTLTTTTTKNMMNITNMTSLANNLITSTNTPNLKIIETIRVHDLTFFILEQEHEASIKYLKIQITNTTPEELYASIEGVLTELQSITSKGYLNTTDLNNVPIIKHFIKFFIKNEITEFIVLDK